MTEPVVIEPRAKLNLGLEVLGRRGDGYHEIATVFQELDLADRLSIEPAGGFSLEVAGNAISAGPENLVWRAGDLLARSCGVALGARLRLDKRIPVQAGLGGGSSDAAAALAGLNRLWSTGLSVPDLMELGARLGSDVPFFLVGGTAMGLGRGDEICPLPDLPPLWVALVTPPRGLSTAAVYRGAQASLTGFGKSNIMKRFSRFYLCGEGLEELVRNDLQPAAAALHPAVEAHCRSLREAGALGAALSGSGSAVYGLFREQASARAALERVGGGAAGTLCRFRARVMPPLPVGPSAAPGE